MRDVIVSLLALAVAVGAGYVWGWQSKGRWFERDRIALQAAASMRVAKENKQLADKLAEAVNRANDAEERTRILTGEKSSRIDNIGALIGGQPVTPAELQAINAQIREVAQ